MQTAERFQVRACDLCWVRHPEVLAILRELHPSLWREVSHNPAGFFAYCSDEPIERRGRGCSSTRASNMPCTACAITWRLRSAGHLARRPAAGAAGHLLRGGVRSPRIDVDSFEWA
jgi:hypothetical protein